MKKITPYLVGGSLLLSSFIGFAATKTDVSAKWICTTNASSASASADKTADDKMAKNAGSASSVFKFAVHHCRDCTKITCEVKSN